MTDSFTLAHLSDPHLPPLPAPRLRDLAGKRALGYLNWTRNRHKYHRREVLDALVADMQAQRPDHIAVTGDLVNLALEAEFTPAQAWLESVGTPQRVTVVPGNHDAYVRATRHRFTDTFEKYLSCDVAEANGTPFPFVRRRGPLALIGVSSAVPTLPLMATGRLGRAQIDALDRHLAQMSADEAFRVLLVHHPLHSDSRMKRLTDSKALRAVLKRHGVELVLHGHDHIHSTMWLEGADRQIPAVGVPSASALAHRHYPAAAYNLFSIARDGDKWRCVQTVRAIDTDFRVKADQAGDAALEILQARIQRQPEQRDRAQHEAEHEGAEAAAARLSLHGRLGGGRYHHRMFALDHAARDIAGDGIDDDGHVMRLGDHDAAEAGVLHEAVDALVAPHHHMRDHVDPQPRRLALADAAIEQVDPAPAPARTADRAPRSGSRAGRLRHRAVRPRRRCGRRPRSGPGAARRAAASVACRGLHRRFFARLTSP